MKSTAGQSLGRPLGVTIVGIIAILGGIFSLLGGLMVLSGMASGPLILAVIVLVFGFLGIGLGSLLILGKPWARPSTIAVYILSVGLGIAEVIYGGTVGGVGGIVRIIAGIVFPIYLVRPGPKAYFSRK